MISLQHLLIILNTCCFLSGALLYNKFKMAAHHVVELAIAKRHPLLGHQMVLPDCENLPPIGRKQKLDGRSFSPIMSGDPSQRACHAGFPLWGTCVRQFFFRGYI
jgi:hypothetical protein